METRYIKCERTISHARDTLVSQQSKKIKNKLLLYFAMIITFVLLVLVIYEINGQQLRTILYDIYNYYCNGYIYILQIFFREVYTKSSQSDFVAG